VRQLGVVLRRSEHHGPFDWLNDSKREHTSRFIEHVDAMPRSSSEARMPTTVGPIAGLRLQGARAGWRMKFVDERGCGVDPPEGTKIQFAVYAAPASSEITPRPTGE
jgi:hypothetical protein